MWAIAWWFARRYLRRRAATTVAGLTAGAGATARSGRVRAIAGAVALVAIAAGAFVAWRRLMGQPAPPEAVASSDGAAPATDAPVPTAAA
jgi:disulfide bond formation protein DsbB